METLETFDEYADRIVDEIHVEAAAQVCMSMLMACNAMKKQEMDFDSARFGGLVLISGNSLVAARYREITDQPFAHEAYFLFPMFLGARDRVLKSLAGNRAIEIPEYHPKKVYVYIFYRGDFGYRQVSVTPTRQDMEKAASLVVKKLTKHRDGEELSKILKEINKRTKEEQK